MQINNDIAPVSIEDKEENDENEMEEEDNTQKNLDKILYSGPFAYTSPPDRTQLNENVEQDHISPFASRYTVLKFNTDSKNHPEKNSS